MRRRRPVALLVALGATVIAGCSDDSTVREDEIVAATVRVRAEGCGPRTELGTGTSIGDGLVITAAHVVAGADRVEVVDQSGASTSADVVMFDPALDVAALRPVTAPTTSVPLRDDPGSAGERGVIALVTTDGAIDVVDIETTQRVTIRTTDIYREEQVQRPGSRITATVEPGDSGAMVHLTGGGVGIVWSRSTENPAQAWTVDVPRQLLEPASRSVLTSAVDTGACV